MIIETKNRRILVWNKKLSNSMYVPSVHRLFFNKYTNQIEFVKGNIFQTHYSIEELESMLIYLKDINKKIIKK